MRTLMIAAIVGCAAVPVHAATANYLLDFDTGGVCTKQVLTSVPDGTLGECSAAEGSNIGLTYGDQPGVDVEWRANANQAAQQRFTIAASPFGGIYADGFVNTPGNLLPGSITFRALDGATVGLHGFAARSSNFVTGGGNKIMNYLITDLAIGGFGSVSGVVESTTVQNDRRAVNLGNLTSSVGIEFRFGVDASAFGWGIDDIAYSVTPAGTVDPEEPLAPIPLPASGVMLLAGLAGLAGLRRRLRA